VELGADCACFTDVIGLDVGGVEARIEAKHRHDIHISKLRLRLSDRPFNDWIIVHSQIVSQPQNYSMHLSLS